MDINRTNSIFFDAGLDSPCDIPFESGKNPIYNILVAYAEFDT